MNTVNISLPTKLRSNANRLVKGGYYSSFSDLVRHSIRQLIKENKYNLWAKKAKEDFKNGKSIVLKSEKDIENFLENI